MAVLEGSPGENGRRFEDPHGEEVGVVGASGQKVHLVHVGAVLLMAHHRSSGDVVHETFLGGRAWTKDICEVGGRDQTDVCSGVVSTSRLPIVKAGF